LLRVGDRVALLLGDLEDDILADLDADLLGDGLGVRVAGLDFDLLAVFVAVAVLVAPATFGSNDFAILCVPDNEGVFGTLDGVTCTDFA